MTAQILILARISREQLPPQNIEAEEAVLGGILIDPGAPPVLDILDPEAFYVSATSSIDGPGSSRG